MSTLQNLRGLLVSTYLFATLLLCNVLQILRVLIYPFSKKICRAINRRLADIWWGLVAWSLEKVIGIKIHLTGDLLPARENAIILPNHQSSADIPPLLWLAWKKGMVGNVKWFVKDNVKWIPGVGWGLWLLGTPFIKRVKAENGEQAVARKNQINRVATILNQYKDHDVPIWMITFLESTRVTKAKLETDAEKTAARNLVPLKHHLYPKRDGIVATIQSLRSHVQAVYDIEILFHDAIPGLWQLANGQAGEITLRIIRTPIENIPQSEDGIYSWVENVFREKDRAFAEFHGLT